MTSEHPDHLIIGVGNRWRGDDGVGPEVIRLLQSDVAEIEDAQVQFRISSGEGTRLMDLWRGWQQVTVIDAASSGSRPGTIHRIHNGCFPAPSPLRCSCHAFGLAEAIQMARILGQVPTQLQVFGIEGTDFRAGDELSEAATAATIQVAREILDQVTSTS